MNIKQVILPSVLLAGLCLPLNAEVPPYWQDPKANRVNVMPARAAFFAFENTSLANQGNKASSNRYLSLKANGNSILPRTTTCVLPTFTKPTLMIPNGKIFPYPVCLK